MSIRYDDEGYSGSYAERLDKHGWKGLLLTFIFLFGLVASILIWVLK